MSAPFEAYVEALAESYTLESLREARTQVALNLASRAARSLEVNLKTIDGRTTSAIVVSTYQEKLDFLTAARAAIARLDTDGHLSGGGVKTDFSQSYVDP